MMDKEILEAARAALDMAPSSSDEQALAVVRAVIEFMKERDGLIIKGDNHVERDLREAEIVAAAVRLGKIILSGSKSGDGASGII
jgi:hypothetical protein